MKATTVKHKPDCTMAFGRKDKNCPRCVELLAGAPPRRWHGSQRQENEARRMAEVRDHFRPGGPHARGDCGPVCTFGDW